MSRPRRLHAPAAPLAPAALVALAFASVALPPVTATAQRGRAPTGDSAPRLPIDGLRLREIGPASTSGRIGDLAVHPHDPSTWYVATASGGLWKTTNAGVTFTPIFDDQPSYSIGAIALDPSDPNVVWVGTGENNSQRSAPYGDGVYKSLDGGRTWANVGLKTSEHIARILVHPQDGNVVYVAAQGPLWSGGGERGLYKTTDGGATWEKILGGGEYTGVNDVQFDPRDPDVLIAATHMRQRRVWGQVNGGPESGIHRSTDGGKTWTRVRTGLPGGDLGRIGLSISPANPDVVYAIVEAAGNAGGFFRSDDRGASWRRMSAQECLGLYYCETFADPTDPDRAYVVDTRTSVTEDGGRTFSNVGGRNKHVDDHVVWIDARDADHIMIGSDGGLYESFDRGENWRWFGNLPLSQFYRVAVDNAEPFYHVYGGTQDNNTVGGPSRTKSSAGIENSDWYTVVGGDGFTVAIDPTDPNIVYAESQNGGTVRHDRRTGENISIIPVEEPGDDPLRWYWDTPLLISPHDPSRIYIGAQRLFRSDNRGDDWRAVSGDLSRAIDRNRLQLMGRTWGPDAVGRHQSTSYFGSIITISESPLQEGLIYVGTDDGLIQVTEDGGATWRAIASVPGVPDTTYVQRVLASRHDVNTVYAVFNGHRSGDFRPYVLVSADRGRTWRSLAATLPERGSVYALAEDPQAPNLLFAGTEFALFVSVDGGARWQRLRGGLPTIQVRDVLVHEREDDLVVATFGRGFWILDDMTPLRALATDTALARRDAALLAVREAPVFLPTNTSNARSWGASYWTADNPPTGATFTYLVRRETRTKRQERQRREQAAARAGQPIPQPTYDELRAEDDEVAPSALLTVRDAAGNVVRRLEGPARAGLHRVTWDLRYAASTPVRGAGGGGRGGFGGGRGPLALPGRYTVTLALRQPDGSLREVGSQPFVAEPPAAFTATVAMDPEVQAFRLRTAKAQRALLAAQATVGEVAARAAALDQALDAAAGDIEPIRAGLRTLGHTLDSLRVVLDGDPVPGRVTDPAAPGLTDRLNRVVGSHWGTNNAPTGTQERQVAIVEEALPALVARVRALVETDLRALEQRAEAAGAPWTPGRLPSWP